MNIDFIDPVHINNVGVQIVKETQANLEYFNDLKGKPSEKFNTDDLLSAASEMDEIAMKAAKIAGEEKNLRDVSRNGFLIKFLTEDQRTQDVCIAAVQNDPHVMSYLTTEQRTADVCMAAVKKFGYPIYFVSEEMRTQDICIAAVKKSGLALKHLSKEQKTENVCMAAVNQCGRALQYVPAEMMTQRVCIVGLGQNGHAIQFLNDAQRTPAVCLAALRSEPSAIKYFSDNQWTRHICDEVMVNLNAPAWSRVLDSDFYVEKAKSLLESFNSDEDLIDNKNKSRETFV